ncbi:MAG: hypothetical protein AMS26_21900 [Bacteroides sp. SM23_62]|nr:MAG: hypothetical protein AMS26_21900 [Bacteroides sp. SM23_62]
MRTEFLPNFIFGLSLFMLLSGCETKPDYIGSDLLPSGDNFTVSFDSMEVINGYTRLGDSIIGSNKDLQLLGSMIDPLFGFSRAGYVTQIGSSSSSGGFGPNPKIDSVILTLHFEGFLGESNLSQQVRVYEFMEYIRKDTNYYTNQDITGLYRQPELGHGRMTGGDTLIRIQITEEQFINKFLQAEDSILASTSYIQQFMYGLYITTDDVTTEGGISTIYADAEGTMLRFYYANDTVDSISQDYRIYRNTCQQFNLFSHDYTGYPIEEFLSGTSRNDSLLFIQSMAGVFPEIRFPGFHRWIDSMPVAINQAKLILPVADTNLLQQKSENLPDRLMIYLEQPDGSYSFVYDYAVEPESFGGTYDNISNSYNFTIKVQLQSLAQGNVDNLEMIIRPVNGDETVTRGVLYGWSEDFMKRIRLEITYTRL